MYCVLSTTAVVWPLSAESKVMVCFSFRFLRAALYWFLFYVVLVWGMIVHFIFCWVLGSSVVLNVASMAAKTSN